MQSSGFFKASEAIREAKRARTVWAPVTGDDVIKDMKITLQAKHASPIGMNETIDAITAEGQGIERSSGKE